jgi:hypothetical protein
MLLYQIGLERLNEGKSDIAMIILKGLSLKALCMVNVTGLLSKQQN